MATTSNELDSSQHNIVHEENDGNDDRDNTFACNICLENSIDAVVSFCGHLYCWPCLYQWLESRRGRKLCPVCKSVINKDKVIPIYGLGNSKKEDPRNKVPPRPAGQRTEPKTTIGFPGLIIGDGEMSFGIGALFFVFLSSFNFTNLLFGPPVGGVPQQDDQYILTLFSWITVIFIAWLLFS